MRIAQLHLAGELPDWPHENPAALLLELGAEANWGGSFPATANGESSPGAWTLFTKIGGDVGDSHSWQAGLSWLSGESTDRVAGHGHGEEHEDGE